MSLGRWDEGCLGVAAGKASSSCAALLPKVGVWAVACGWNASHLDQDPSGLDTSIIAGSTLAVPPSEPSPRRAGKALSAGAGDGIGTPPSCWGETLNDPSCDEDRFVLFLSRLFCWVGVEHFVAWMSSGCWRIERVGGRLLFV